uniref:2,3-bisphosphoglycerate-independent phosphoglycerate mutase n=1 Tax=Caulacanthus okamurae TaxID=152008 RepID=A0A6H1U798_9FLOR|nr:phosphoglycerate mutase [Caulacanthus okamurae]QIZ74752.1 phosphoglycerate mutase [Caulacanthus okamurae]
MQQESLHPIILTILDGWGYSKNLKGNAIKLAKTPVIDKLWQTENHALLSASGNDVGLPSTQMGNSEVGHTTIGAGRIIDQDLVKINTSIENGTFFKNSALEKLCKTLKIHKSKLHLIGLCSNGGVHSHIDHLIELIKKAKEYNLETCIHVITDGRDTKPLSCKFFLQEIIDQIKDTDNINICTISGRYYSMDRDCRWSRTEKAYKVLVENNISNPKDPIDVVDYNYKNGISDEFIVPIRIYSGSICNNDGMIFFNFRPDRIRQLFHCFTKNPFKAFTTYRIDTLNIITFTQYDSSLSIPIIFPPNKKKNFLGEIISKKGFKQLRLAETEKYAHVTYFFNGGVEEPFPGEYRELISSPLVDTYDLAPAMSAYKLTNSIIKAVKKNIYKFIVINYANPDMVGHTGNLEATIEAIEVVDKCIGKLLKEIENAKATLILTADHGNAEYMITENDTPCTSHSTNFVPLMIYVHNRNTKNKQIELRKRGSLADIAPTILELLNIEKPEDMNGKSLIDTTQEK